MKIGCQLTKLLQKISGLLFFGPPCMFTYTSMWSWAYFGLYFSRFNVAAEACAVFVLLSGSFVRDLDYIVSEESLFNRKENAGFLYFRPSYQCLQGFTIPRTPFLIAILILQSEVVWARILPLRLLLRLGSEYRCKWFVVWQFQYSRKWHYVGCTWNEICCLP